MTQNAERTSTISQNLPHRRHRLYKACRNIPIYGYLVGYSLRVSRKVFWSGACDHASDASQFHTDRRRRFQRENKIVTKTQPQTSSLCAYFFSHVLIFQIPPRRLPRRLFSESGARSQLATARPAVAEEIKNRHQNNDYKSPPLFPHLRETQFVL